MQLKKFQEKYLSKNKLKELSNLKEKLDVRYVKIIGLGQEKVFNNEREK